MSFHRLGSHFPKGLHAVSVFHTKVTRKITRRLKGLTATVLTTFQIKRYLRLKNHDIAENKTTPILIPYVKGIRDKVRTFNNKFGNEQRLNKTYLPIISTKVRPKDNVQNRVSLYYRGTLQVSLYNCFHCVLNDSRTIIYN